MALPEIPERITGAFVHSYIAECSEEAKARFASLQKMRGITIPNNTNVLCSKQIKLFMDSI